MLISLVICTRGDSHRVLATLRQATAALNAVPQLCELVLVDNSPGGMDVEVDDERIRVVRCVLPGLSRARTVGSVHARGDVLVYTDDDVVFAPDWPGLMAAPIFSGRLDATVAPVRLAPAFDHVGPAFLREWLAEGNLDGKVRMIGAGMAIDRDLLGYGLWDQQIGAGNPDYGFGEETLFEAMIRSVGARVGVVSEAQVTHRPDVARLGDDEWRATARKKGWSEAYLDHHWRGKSARLTTLRLLARRGRLSWHRSFTRRREGWRVRELVLIEAYEYAKALRRLAYSPRAYPAGAGEMLPAGRGGRRDEQ